ncbi:MAG TPA: HtaA domain-containing protein [Solirubrobacterales bacterium]|nr:HtaA domain-containing protein [Solirubrobacterales bacterium]
MRVGLEARLGAAALAAGLILAAPAAAPAASASSGQAVLELNGAAAKALRASGVRIAPTGAAQGGARQVRFPIGAGLVGSSTTVLRFGGGLAFSRGKQRLQLGGLRLTLGQAASLRGRLGGESLGLFRVLEGGQRELDPARGSIRLSGLRLKLRRGAAKEIAERLGLTRRPTGNFGVLSATEEGLQPGSPPPVAGPTGKGSTGCALPSTAGSAPEQPLPVAARPAGAADVTGATVSWDVRESFIRYINAGEGTSVFDGATAAAPEVRAGSAVPLAYSFAFPFANGWHHPGADPSDPADDKAALYFTGGVHFLYSSHGIDLRTSAPELEIAGGASRAIFAVAEGEAAPERQVIVNLDLSRAASVQATGGTFTYQHVPGAIPEGTASSVFAGFYAPGTDFGCFTVSYSTAS